MCVHLPILQLYGLLTPFNNLCVSCSHFSYINKQIYYRVLRRITYMSKVARYQGSTVFCETIQDILVRARRWGGQVGQLHGAQTYKRHYDIIGIIRITAPRSTCGRISQKNVRNMGTHSQIGLPAFYPRPKMFKEYRFDVTPNY